MLARQPFGITPNTTTGKWSVGLIIAMPVLFLIGTTMTSTLYGAIPSGDTILADIATRPALALTMLAGMVAGVSALITGLLAILREKDHALLVYVATLFGALETLFLIGELLFPH